MKQFRSLLFVPGNKPEKMHKALHNGADGLILDLEDSVPIHEKKRSRGFIRDFIKDNLSETPLFVRVNALSSDMTYKDLESIVGEGLYGVILPKVEKIGDIIDLDALLTYFEEKRNLIKGGINTPLLLETASGIYNAYNIARKFSRINIMILSAGPGGDSARSIGFRWSKEGKETLFLRSKVILDGKAAGIQHPMISSWWNIPDLKGLEQDARQNFGLGFKGMVVIHPSHISVVNRVFTPSRNEIEYCKGLIEAVEDAKKRGEAALQYKGMMVDSAMVKTAKELIAASKSLGIDK